MPRGVAQHVCGVDPACRSSNRIDTDAEASDPSSTCTTAPSTRTTTPAIPSAATIDDAAAGTSPAAASDDAAPYRATSSSAMRL